MGKTTRPCRYDLNQIPYDYTVEVMDRFKVVDLVYRVPKELWTDVHDIVLKAVNKTIPKKKKCKKTKWLSEEALQIAEHKGVWVWHKPSWRRSPLTPPQNHQNVYRTGETDSWRTQTKPYVHQNPGERSSDPTRD